MNPSISEKVIKPERCAVAFGIPTSWQTFERDNTEPNGKNRFAKGFGSAWDKFGLEIIAPFQKVVPVVTKLGVNVRTDVTLAEFGQLVSNEQFDLVVLFAHWGDDAVEFHDGFACVPDMIEHIPVNFDRILDLSVCHPDSLVLALRRDRPDSLVRHIGFRDEEKQRKKVTPRLWMFFYLALFKHLKHRDVTYNNALIDVIQEFKQITQRGKP